MPYTGQFPALRILHARPAVVKMALLKSFLLAWIGLVTVSRAAGQTVLTNTTLGPVLGVKLGIPGGPPIPVVTRYAGIPYAEPPIGPRRFAKPVPKAPWGGVLNATTFGSKCPQAVRSEGAPVASLLASFGPSTGVAEDCLFLNVYVPHDVVDALGPLPVMVYVHGGGLNFGEGARYDGTLIALRGQVVVVNINYRLGLFGFLSTGDDSAPGNYGLWDQRLAIRWVKDNVANFGGDPDQITIFGQSAGAWSVTFQMASPVNDRSLFQRVIAQSGVAFPGLVIPGHFAQYQAWQLASSSGCNLIYGVSTTRDLISCLRGLSMEELLRGSSIVTTAATVDGEFLPTDINSLLSQPRVGQYDLLLGVTSQEGSVFPSEDNYTAEGLRDAIQTQIALTCRCENPREITDAVFAFYFGADELEDPASNLLKFFDVVGDVVFDVPAAALLREHAELSAGDAKTYQYYFDYEVGKELVVLPGFADRLPGAPHSLDLVYVFGLVNLLFPGNTEAITLSDAIIQYWSAFARNGNPNTGGLSTWPEFEAENQTYIILDANITTGQRLKADKVAFWSDYIPSIAELTDKKTCSYEVPVRSGSERRPDTKTVQISSQDGEVLGSVIGALQVADEAMGGREIAEFLGIPYAKPPLGDLRFRPPQDTGPWGDDPLGIPEMLPPACPQDVTRDPWMVRLGFNRTSEDCLTLNIYAPSLRPSEPALPVVFFIHPGYGVIGTSSVQDGTLLASQIEAVVVVINHRLGALGFLSTEDEVAPGNYGLNDILAALKWVNKYIGSFGGDPDRVTVQGHGSGAVLAHFLILSEKAQGLFGRAIVMSASAISPPVDNPVIPRASEKAEVLANKLGCPTSSSELMIECLREKPAADLVSNTATPPFGLAFPTVVDGDIIADKPLALMKSGRINDVAVIFGVAQDEDAAPAFSITGLACPSVQQVQQYIQLVSSLSFPNPEKVAPALITEYLGKGGLGDDCQARGSFRQLMNDYLSFWSTVEAARLHADAGHSVFYYSFDQEPPAHYIGPLPPQAGPALTDDLQYLFGDPYSPLVDELQLSYRLEDKQFTLELMAFFKNFVHTGNPGSSLSGVQWPAFDSVNLTYMSLTDCPQVYSGNQDNWQHLHRFWADYLPSLTALVPPPPEVTPCPTAPAPCLVGDGIGLSLTPEEANTLIEALIGVAIGALVLSVFCCGCCFAYRARAGQSETHWPSTRAPGFMTKRIPNDADSDNEFMSQL